MYRRRIVRWGWQKKDKDGKYIFRAAFNKKESSSLRDPGRPKVIKSNLRTRPSIVHSGPLGPSVARIPPSPTDTPALRIPVLVIKNVFDYISGSFETGVFVLDESGIISSKSGGHQLRPLRDIFVQHYRACLLIDQRLFSEAREVLDDAFAQLKRIVNSEHPRTICTIFALVLFLRARGRSEIGALLLKNFAAFAHVYNGVYHPAVQGCEIFMPLDNAYFDHLLALIIHYGNDLFRKFSGSKYDKEEVSVQQLMTIFHNKAHDWHGTISPADFEIAESLLGDSLMYQGKFSMAERVALLLLSGHRSDDSNFIAECPPSFTASLPTRLCEPVPPAIRVLRPAQNKTVFPRTHEDICPQIVVSDDLKYLACIGATTPS